MTPFLQCLQKTDQRLRWTCALAWMVVIFLFSSAANSNETTQAVFGDSNFYVRKLAHMTEFAILFLLLRWALLKKDQPVWHQFDRKATATAAALAVIYALSDEYHQSFVPGRSAQLSDVLIDSGGITTAFIALCPWRIKQN